MAYQFVHIQTYSLKSTKVAGTNDHFNDLNQVFGEALREPRYCDHVPAPRTPAEIKWPGAIPLTDLRAHHDTRRAAIRETVQQRNGGSYERGLKSDAPTLYTEIHSHPMTSEEYRACSKDDRAEVNKWMRLVVKDFVSRMPPGIEFSAVLHLDEKYVHIHILALNMADPKLSANKLHVGKCAAAQWREEHGPAQTITSLPRPELEPRPSKPKRPKPSKNRMTQAKREAAYVEDLAAWEESCAEIEQRNAEALDAWKRKNDKHLHLKRKTQSRKHSDKAAYEAAMTSFQDRYYEAVGKPCGLLRHGPRKERLSTVQYGLRKAQAEHIAKVEAAQRDLVLSNRKKSQALEKKEQAQSQKAKQIEMEQEALEARREAAARQDSALTQRERAV
ncbi:Mob protein, partial [Thioclava sp. 15-R06ZXC-3]